LGAFCRSFDCGRNRRANPFSAIFYCVSIASNIICYSCRKSSNGICGASISSSIITTSLIPSII
jgi:hypothetical protein